MGEKIVIGPFNKGLKNDRPPFMIDNDSFPVLLNAYQWRGRVKRKRGTSLLGRLSRFLGTTDGSGNLIVTILPVPIETGIVSFTIGTDVFVDPGTTADPTDQILITNSSGTGTLNRVTGVLTITGSIINTAVIYYPSLPVMGLRDLNLDGSQFSDTLGFDTTYAYNILTDDPFDIYDVSFYKNPAADGTNLPGYVPKSVWTPTTWNGQDYQQFWSVNYQGAFWVTNGINIPFSPTNIGMQFAGPSTTPTLSAAARLTPTIMSFTIVGNPLVVGDYVFANEFTASAGGDASTLNFQTGYVISSGNTFSVTFPFANITAGTYTPGILQYLTNRSSTTVDCIRWYDGDPTNANATNPTFVLGNGWVNFMPPLSQSNFSVGELPPRQYYLVGARMIVPFKDRLLFLGAVVQASTGNPIYLQDTIVYSQNGTPYYTASFTGAVDLSTTVFHPILVPINQTATPTAYFEDQTGFGGFVSAGLNQQITTCSSDGDVQIIGFNNVQARLVYSGNDVVPFNFYIVNSELGSASTFSVINMDQGVITRGSRGYVITGQTNTQRIDPDIPDEVFEINLKDNGNERFTAQRDFINEWIYFTYTSNQNDVITYRYPNTTLQYNYRDNTWALFRETYTTYGSFQINNGLTWSTVGKRYGTWSQWNAPWNSGSSTLLQPKIIAGNQQGFIVFRDQGTDEANSLYIQNIASNVVTSADHGLNTGDYIIISDALGTIGYEVNSKIFSVGLVTTNTFTLNPAIGSGTYLGGGVIKRLYVPFIQTKQFPVAWEMARKTRLGPQQYLLTTTETSQITLLIYLSQDADNAYNDSPIVPDPNSINNTLIFSTVLYTCPESTNLGLTPSNINLNMVTAITQAQIWHRVNTSLLGDTVQLGFSLSDSQMRSLDQSGSTVTITGITQADPAVLTTSGPIPVDQLIQISGVLGMTELNGNNYFVISSTPTSVTIGVDSSAFTAYISGGIATPIDPINQTAEIELMGIILDVSPSMNLA